MSGRTTPPEESLTFRNGAAPLTVEFYENRIEARSHPAKTVRLPATGTSSEVVFPVQVGPDEERLHCTVRVYHHRRLLQNLELSGPVATEDRRVGEDEISLAGDAFRSLVSSPQRGLHKRSTSIVINRSDEACFRGKGMPAEPVTIAGLDIVRRVTSSTPQCPRTKSKTPGRGASNRYSYCRGWRSRAPRCWPTSRPGHGSTRLLRPLAGCGAGGRAA